MSTQTKAKAAVVEKCTDEELLVLMIAANGGTAPGIKAYEVYAKLDEKGHSAASFRHTFSALAVKAKELLAKKPEVELLDAVAAAATPKKAVAVGRKRKAADDGEGADGGEAADGGEDVANASGGGKKVKIAAKAKGGAKKGGKKVVMDEEVKDGKVKGGKLDLEEVATEEELGDMEYLQTVG